MYTYRPKGRPRGQENIPALEKAGNEAARMKENPDNDLSHVGQVIKGLMDKLIKMRKEQGEKIEGGDSKNKKIFYTSAEASAREEDDY